MKNNAISFLEIVLFVTLLYAVYLLFLLSLPYLQFKRNVDFLKTKELIYHLRWWRWSFYVHVFSSPIVILSGLFQFNRYVIRSSKKLHKILGWIYFSTLFLLAAPSGLLIGLYANGGYPTQISFALLSCFWILSSALALVAIKNKDFYSHGKWMVRSFALTLSAVTLRFYAYLMDVFHFDADPITAYTILAYASWIPNLLFAEILIRLGYVQKIQSYFLN